jgi:long-chain acyl-CoA synthetase
MTNPLYMPHELEHQMTDAEVDVIVTVDFLVGRVLSCSNAAQFRHIIATSLKDYMPKMMSMAFPLVGKKQGIYADVEYNEQVLSYTKLLKKSSEDPISVDIDGEDIALLQYTGGTTGFSKGAMLTHNSLVANTYQAKLWMYNIQEGQEKFLALLPLFHVFGLTVLLNLAVYTAGEILLKPKFDATEVLEYINKEKPTLFPGAPTMFIALINHPKIKEYDLSSLRLCISGSASLPVEVQEKFEKLSGSKLVEGFGLTEASPITHLAIHWDDTKRKVGSIGMPVTGTLARVVNSETGEEVPRGDVGELVIQGPQVMKGFWKNPKETARALRDGWLYTGDVARQDNNGHFYIVDRTKDIIIASGYNVYPREVEEVLYTHPAIGECVVAGVPDAYRGETIKAYIVLKPGQDVSSDELNTFSRSQLAAYKVPRIYEFRDALPKTAVGKILRRKLVEEEKELVAQQQAKDAAEAEIAAHQTPEQPEHDDKQA